ncbi:MAG: hypothetical protein GIX03_01980 [Candidatus Eremiobacteraeota bacterium]|nr:hypothetical protein [Candidatus Eremiobacteraeota bacterium]MBC5801787.1 hypothetical protein [Candidatus Eremiobacteraeota bacterium]MBC5823148.1 hypothetical protein [Candidatus Eremiobacteraeota bacterium]
MTYTKALENSARIATLAALVATPIAGSTHPLTPAAGNVVATAQAEKRETADAAADLRGILTIEGDTEAIAEGEKTGRAATAAADQAVAMWPAVRASLAGNGAMANHLTAVDRSIVALRNELGRHSDLRRDANEVTGALAPLFAAAGHKVPSNIHRLDYLGRSITLDVKTGEWARAQRDSNMLASTWQAVRSRVIARPGGGAAAARYDRTVKTVSRGVDSRNAAVTLNATKASGAGVDALEKVFGA